MMNYSSAGEGGRSIPLVYTNDPKSVSNWFQDNLSTEGGTIGFDIEVSVSFGNFFLGYGSILSFLDPHIYIYIYI